MTMPRSACSLRIRISAREGIYNDVHAEARVVHSREALAVRAVIPLRAVILAAVQNPDATALHHRLKILVHQIVTPSVELVARRRRTVAELEEAAIDLVVVRQIIGRRECPRDL